MIMAVTALWAINGRASVLIDYAINPEKTSEGVATDLHKIGDVIQYAADDLKTEKQEYVTCLNCSGVETAAEDFLRTKQLWNKLGGRQCFHGYQSFKPGEVDAETAHAIGVELAKRCWGDRFQVVVATHCNTDCYHNHFVLSSVSFVDGLHFVKTPMDYQFMREMSDWLCRRYRISVIENPSGRGMHYAQIKAEKRGMKSVRTTIREEIDLAVNTSLTFDEFQSFLRRRGYAFHLYTKSGDDLLRPGLKPPGASGFFRFDTLGAEYSLDRIKTRIQKNLRRQLPFPEAEQAQVRYRRQEHQPEYIFGKSSLHKLYLRYCFELHIIKEHPASVKRVPFSMRWDLMELDKLDAETQLLGKHNIHTIDELRAYRLSLTETEASLMAQRKELRNDVRRHHRNTDPVKEAAAIQQVKSTTQQLRKLRKQIVLCNDIALRSARTREELEALIQQESRDDQTQQREEPASRARSERNQYEKEV